MNEYKLFSDFLDLSVKKYYFRDNKLIVKQIVKQMTEILKKIYNNKEAFKYVLERCYSDNRNPFTTAYSEFMSLVHEINLDNLIKYICEGILYRKFKEYQTNNIYVVF